ncbi:MAG: protein translocase subunit SecF, partial [Spirochaetales bacterium]
MEGEMKTVQFTKLRFMMIGMSVLLIAAGLAVTILRGGFNLGVDFQAGLSLRVAVTSERADVNIESVRAAVSGIDGVQVQTIGSAEDQQFTIRVRDAGEIDDFSSTMSNEIVDSIAGVYGESSVQELENTYVGPRISADLTRNTVLLTSLAMLFILVYIWFRFQLGYSASAI